jgi:hypothetical protein
VAVDDPALNTKLELRLKKEGDPFGTFLCKGLFSESKLEEIYQDP